MTLRCGDDGDPRQRVGRLIDNAMRFRILRAGFRMRRDPTLLEITVERPAGGVPRVRFCVRLIGQAALDHSPMVEKTRDVADLTWPGAGDAAQGEIIILGTVESFPKSADLAEQRGAINPEVIQVILRQKKLRVPVRFEKRI